MTFHKTSLFLFLMGAMGLTASCGHSIQIQGQSQSTPDLFPDYREVTVPKNIAPLNLSIKDEGDHVLLVRFQDQEIQVRAHDQHFEIPQKQWHRLLEKASGSSIQMTVVQKEDGLWKACPPFNVHIQDQEIDPYLVYRLLSTRYGRYDHMGLYQRDLSSFKEYTVYDTALSEYNCVNCHTFLRNDPGNVVFHLRNRNAATMLVQDGQVKKLNTKTPETISAFVYPSWHPSGRFIAFSTNETPQEFFYNNPRSVLEVYDRRSDIVIYDVRTDEVFSTPLLKGDTGMETYPLFSPDGESLYFSSCAQVEQMPRDFEKVEYSLCRIDFNPDSRTFGQEVDTLFHGASQGKSVSFAKISPDGRGIVFTVQDYGSFAEWHPDSDLYYVDLATKEIRRMDEINSDAPDGYHSWGSDSGWMVFSSRRQDGNYTLPYFSYIDKDGHGTKPFLLPQKDPLKYYQDLIEVFNLPELVTGKVTLNARNVALSAMKEPGVDVRFVGGDGSVRPSGQESMDKGETGVN